MTGLAADSPEEDVYEFTAADGNAVYLHDMQCRSIAFHPVDARLELSFVDYSPTPTTVRFEFTGVAILRWDHDGGTPAEHAGEVRDLYRYDDTGFELHLPDETLTFTAARFVICTS